MPQSKVTPVVVGRTDGEEDGAVATAAVASATARFATVEDVARAEQRERSSMPKPSTENGCTPRPTSSEQANDTFRQHKGRACCLRAARERDAPTCLDTSAQKKKGYGNS